MPLPETSYLRAGHLHLQQSDVSSLPLATNFPGDADDDGHGRGVDNPLGGAGVLAVPGVEVPGGLRSVMS